MQDETFSFWTQIKRYEDELDANPASFAYVPLADLYRELGLLDDAVLVAQKGCALHPDHVEGLLCLAAACEEKGYHDEARQALERVLRLAPANSTAMKLLGRIFAEDGLNDDARHLLEQVLAADPGDSETSFLLKSLPSSARPSALEEIEELTDELKALDQLDPIEEMVELEEFESAEELDDLEEFDELLELRELEEMLVKGPKIPFAPAEPPQQPPPKPKDPFSTVTLAELYASQGFLDKALGVYRQIIAEDPGNPDLQKRLAELEDMLARPSVPQVSESPEGETVPAEVITRLSSWLENIRRRRHVV